MSLDELETGTNVSSQGCREFQIIYHNCIVIDNQKEVIILSVFKSMIRLEDIHTVTDPRKIFPGMLIYETSDGWKIFSYVLTHETSNGKRREGERPAKDRLSNSQQSSLQAIILKK